MPSDGRRRILTSRAKLKGKRLQSPRPHRGGGRYGPAHVQRVDRLRPHRDATFCEVADSLGPHATASDGAAVVGEDLARFDWDHVLIDEAQDWADAKRDLLVAVYGSRRMVLADGLVQLIRRHTSCDWMRGLAKTERVVWHLGDSLRMQQNRRLRERSALRIGAWSRDSILSAGGSSCSNANSTTRRHSYARSAP